MCVVGKVLLRDRKLRGFFRCIYAKESESRIVVLEGRTVN